MGGYTPLLRSFVDIRVTHQNCLSNNNKTPKEIYGRKKTKPIYQFWCSDWFFWFFSGFFWFFFGFFFGIFWFFLVFWGWHSNPKIKCQKNQKIPKKTKKTQKNQKKPKKPKNQFPISNVGQSLSQKNQKKPKKTKKTSFYFRILAKTNAKKPKKIKKTKKKQCQFENFKNQIKPKKPKKPMPIYRFWCSDWFFFVFFWVSNFECWPKLKPKKPKKKPKKTKKTSFYFRILAKTNAKKTKKN